MKTVKIFLASSIEDLKEDRVAIGNYFRQLNDIYVKKGIYFELVMCEDYDNSMAAEGKQSQYDREIEGSELCFFLFFRKAGEYTKHEFEVAMESFKDKAKPKIITYFKDVVEGESIAEDVRAFMSLLDGEFKHYYNTYGHIDTLKLGIIMQIKLMKLDSSEVKVEDGEVKLDGVTVAKSENVPILNGNEALRSLTERKRELQLELARCRRAYLDEPSEANETAFFNVSRELNEVSQSLTELEREVLAFMSTVAEMTSDGRVLTHRQKEALDYFNKGEYDTAQCILEDAERENELQRAENKVEAGKSEISGYIEEELLWIDAEKAKGINKESAKRIIDKYKKIRELIEKHDLDVWILYEYAIFLRDQKHYPEATEVTETIYRRLTASDIELLEEREATLLNMLGLLYSDEKHYAEAEKYYRRSVELYEKLRDTDPAEYESDLAISYNNLAVLLYHTDRIEESEKYYLLEMEIYERLAGESFEDYGKDLAISYNNLAISLGFTKGSLEAEKYYLKAMEILEKLYSADPRDIEDFMSETCNNMGALYSDMEQWDKAEQYIVRAMEIRKRLSDENPDAYEPELALSYNNLGNLYRQCERYEESREYHLKGLEIRKRLYSRNADAFRTDLAMSYWNLGILYENQGKKEEAIEAYEASRELLLILEAQNPGIYTSRIDSVEWWISDLKGTHKKSLLARLFRRK